MFSCSGPDLHADFSESRRLIWTRKSTYKYRSESFKGVVLRVFPPLRACFNLKQIKFKFKIVVFYFNLNLNFNVEFIFYF